MYDIILFTEGSDHGFKLVRPLGAYSVATALRQNGFKVFVLNNFTHFIEKGNINQIIDKLIGPNTLWAGFSSTLFVRRKTDMASVEDTKHARYSHKLNYLWHWPTTDEKMTSMIDHIKSKGVKIVYGGTMGEQNLETVSPWVDYYVRGMGETHAVDLSFHLRDGKDLPRFRVHKNKTYILDYDKDGIQFDFRNHVFKYEPYDFWYKDDAMGIEFGRGCIFKCKFCSYPLIGKHKKDISYLKTKESIKAELLNNYKMFGTHRYMIMDDTFNEQTAKLEVIADAIDELKDEVPEEFIFGGFIRVDLIVRFPEQIELLERIGMRSWFLGIESLNHMAAKTIGKGCPKEKVYETIRKCREVMKGRLSVQAGFIVGLPYDDRETIDAWTSELYDNDCFDSYAFTPLILGGTSELSLNPERYGYVVDKEARKWTSKDWTSDEVGEYTRNLHDTLGQNVYVGSFFLILYLCIGIPFEKLKEMKYTDLYLNPDIVQKTKDYLEYTYFSKVEKHLGLA